MQDTHLQGGLQHFEISGARMGVRRMHSDGNPTALQNEPKYLLSVYVLSFQVRGAMPPLNPS